MQDLYVNLAIPLAVDTVFTYSVPPQLRREAQRGVRVVAPFGRRSVIGFVLSLSRTRPDLPHLKEIQEILDPEPLIPEELLKLAEWMAEYYLAPPGEVLKSFLVQGSMRPARRVAEALPSERADSVSLTPVQSELLAEIRRRRQVSLRHLRKRFGMKSLSAPLNELARLGLVALREENTSAGIRPKVEQVIQRGDRQVAAWREWLAREEHSGKAARQAACLRELIAWPGGEGAVPLGELLKKSGAPLSSVRALVRKEILTLTQREEIRTSGLKPEDDWEDHRPITLNSAQEKALATVADALRRAIFAPFLLHGVTGSGKTQVYIEAIRKTLDLGKTAILLVPEIALTPQIVRRFMRHFPGQIALLHSRMSAGERFDAWRMAREGRAALVIGPRSAIFAPLKNVGLIVVDEEQEGSYKQSDQTPRYHARDVAIMRAYLSNAAVILGSATPSLESYTNATAGKYTILELAERVDGAQLPSIRVIDMTEERKKEYELFLAGLKSGGKRKFEIGPISGLLMEKILDRLTRKEGIILLQNRRGYSPFIECPECGHVPSCEQCNISLTYHLTQKHLRCHYCGAVKKPPETCSECGSREINYRGFGTQRVEAELKKHFPGARVARMDLDTTSARGSHDALLRQFGTGMSDILLGTQMVAKGLDFPRVTLVGVISADTQMLLPDFRSAERTFQMLTQVAGRAGRSTLSGEVVIQTCQPRHYGLRHVLAHNFRAFYEEELALRRELDYPPFSRLVLIEFKGRNEDEVLRHATAFRAALAPKRARMKILGPAPAALAKLRGLHRWHIVLKGLKADDPSGELMHKALHAAMGAYRESPLGKKTTVRITIDVDPVGMM
jgi:primosomal protein N' (replication factor Y)